MSGVDWEGDFRRDKKARTKHFDKSVKGWKLKICLACNGSGTYDSGGSPPCGSCNGTGKERYKDSQ
jgi:DnaJ-class molecular chaperone